MLPYLTPREAPQNLRPEARRALGGGLDARNAAGAVVTLELTGYVGGDFDFNSVAAALRDAAGRPIIAAINSEGGDHFQGVAIHAALRRHGAPIAVQVMGLAASAAATIAFAADPGSLSMARGARLMVHRATALTYGDATDLATMSGLLGSLDRDTATLLSARSGMSEAKASSLIDATTFLGAEQAIALGLADAVLNQDAEAAPEPAQGPRPTSKMELAAVLHEAGFSRAAASRIAAGGWGALSNEAEPEIDFSALAQIITTNTAALAAAIRS